MRRKKPPGTVRLMSSLRSLGAALLLASFVAAVAALLAVPAGAATVSVEVRDDRYVPAEVEIVVGDQVQWLWVGQGDHSVWFPGIEHSHPGCTTASPSSCSNPGDEPYQRRFNESGEFGYLCRFHGASMSGTVIVREAGTPSPTPTTPTVPTTEDPSPSPTPTPKPTPSAEPSEEPSEDPSEDPTEEPTEDPSSEPPSETPFVHLPPPPPSPPPPPRQLPLDPVPDASPSDAASPSEIDFEPFPEPGEGSDDPAGDEVAVDFPGGGDPDRPVLLAVATLAVVGSATTFGALVLFGPPWMGG